MDDDREAAKWQFGRTMLPFRLDGRARAASQGRSYRRQPRLLGGVAIAGATILSLLASAVSPVPALGRPRDIAILAEGPSFLVDQEQVRLCVDQKDRVTVFVRKQIDFRRRTDPPSTRRTTYRQLDGPVRVLFDNDAPHVVSVTPPFAAVSPTLDYVILRLQGMKAGTATIEVQDDVKVGLTVRINVVVEECEIRLAATSIWQLSLGFNPTFYGRIREIPLRRTGTGVYEATTQMANRAVAPPFANCDLKFNVAPSRVDIKITIVDRGADQKMNLDVIYGPASVEIPLSCPGPMGRRVGAEGGGTDTPFRLQHFGMPAFERVVSETGPHSIQTQLGVKEGETAVVIRTSRKSAPPPPPAIP
jgi:hypothetical protein